MSKPTRPKCANCGKPLVKFIHSILVPFDCDIEKYIDLQFQDRAFYLRMDKLETVRDCQIAQRLSYDQRIEWMKEAQLRLSPGSNEPRSETLAGQNEKRHDEQFAQEPNKSLFDVRVRVWFGSYGPDGRGLFHSGECAKGWAISIASKLREQGKI